MLSTNTRLKLQDILRRLAHGSTVSLEERVYVQKFSERDRTVDAWLRQARRFQLSGCGGDDIDNLLGDLNLGPSDPDQRHRPSDGDLGDWFGGAAGWLRRD